MSMNHTHNAPGAFSLASLAIWLSPSQFKTKTHLSFKRKELVRFVLASVIRVPGFPPKILLISFLDNELLFIVF